MSEPQFQCDVTTHDHSIETRLVGVLNWSSLQQLFLKSVLAASEAGLNQILLDLRQSIIDEDTDNIFSFENELRALGLTQNHRVAVAFESHQIEHDFFTSVLQEHGWSGIRVFKDFDEAGSWLTQTS
jgi:hypothetical protein